MFSKFTNPSIAQQKAYRYLGKHAHLYRSTRKHKKYQIMNPENHWVHFGQLGYEDFTKHRDQKRRKNYLTRTAKIRGNWRQNKYSANNLARNILW